MERSYQSLSDKELLGSFVRNGDEEAFNCLVQRHKLGLFNVAFRVLYDRHAAEDVVQRVFVRLVQRKAELANVRSPEPWLYATTLNLSIDVQRNAGSRRRREKAVGGFPGPETPRDVAMNAELRTELDMALRSLNNSLRIPIVLRYLQGMSYAEASEVMDLASDTVRKRVKSGLRLLKKLLFARGLVLPVVAVEAGLRGLPAKAASVDFLTSSASIIRAASTAGVAGTAASVLKGGLVVTAKTKAVIGIGAALLLAGALVHFAQKGGDSKTSTDRSRTSFPLAERGAAPRGVEGTRDRDGGIASPAVTEVTTEPMGIEDFDIAGKVVGKTGEPIEGVRVWLDVLEPASTEALRPTCMTQGDGSFAFRCPGVREYYLVASKQDYVRVEGIFTRPQKDIVIMMLVGGAIEGTVVDAVTEQPLEQFRIVQSRDYGFSRVEEVYRSDRGRLCRDGEGRFRLGGLEAGTYMLTSIAEGYAQTSAQGIKVELEKVTGGVLIKQQPAGGIRGHVVDVIGNPIGWAEIVQKTDLSKEYPSLARALATSDEKGEFEIGGLPEGTLTFEARHGHYSPAERTVEVKTGEIIEGVEFQLGEGGMISGMVVAEVDSLPVAGATVRLRAGPREPHNIMTHSGGITTETDTGGHFQFINVKPGTYYLTASAPDFPDETVDDVVLEGNKAVKELIIKLSQGGSLVGTVRDHGGKPIADVDVHAVCVLMQKRARTDEEGNYAITGLKEGRYSAGVSEVSTRTHTGRSEDFNVQIEDGRETKLDIVIGGPLRVYGKVTIGGEPLLGVKVVLSSSPRMTMARKSDVTASDHTDPNGHYEIGDLKAGEYVLFVVDTSTRTKVLLVDEDVEKNIEIPEGSIAGRVIDAETGRAIEGAKVGLQRSQARDFREAWSLKRGYLPSDRTDPEGRYKFSAVEDGEYFLVASKEGCAPQGATAEVQNSEGPSDLDILLSKGTILRGRVTGSDPSQPIREIFLSARDSHGAMVYSKKINLTPGGEYETDALTPDEYTISVEAKAHAPAVKKTRIVAGGNNRADFMLPVGGTLIVRAIDHRGILVPGARANVVDEAGNFWLTFFPHTELTLEEGVTAVPNISEGRYRVEIDILEYQHESLDVTIREGDTTDVSVRLRRSR
jgi:RNA polymerase sigma factor (sigma-70 family)